MSITLTRRRRATDPNAPIPVTAEPQPISSTAELPSVKPIPQPLARPQLEIPTYTPDPQPEIDVELSDGSEARQRVADALQFETDRLNDLQHTPAARKNGKWKSAMLGALTGAGQAAQASIASGRPSLGAAIGGAAGGAIAGGINDRWDEEVERQRQMAEAKERIGFEMQKRKIKGQLEDQQAGTDLKRAQAEYYRERPGIEREKANNKRLYDEWRMKSADRKQDTYESYLKWRMENGDRRAETAEGRLELQREYNEIRSNQFDRTYEQRERFESRRRADREADRGLRRDIAAESMSLRRAAIARGMNKEQANSEASAYEADYYDRLADELEADAKEIEDEAKANKGWFGSEGSPSEDQQKQISDLRKRSQRWRDMGHKARAKASSKASSSVSQAEGPPESQTTFRGRVSRVKFREKNPQHKNTPDAEIDRLLRSQGYQGY